jgi:hypothetical protein
LSKVVAEYGDSNWKRIADVLNTQTGGVVNRTDVQCSQRWKNSINHYQQGGKRGSWKPDEDDLLRRLVGQQQHQHGLCTIETTSSLEWASVARHIPGRTHKSCRERYCRYLAPWIKKGPWTTQEDELLISLEIQMGHKWAEMAKTDGLIGRTGEAIKMRWNQLKKKRRSPTISTRTLPAMNSSCLPSIQGPARPMRSCKPQEPKRQKGGWEWVNPARNVNNASGRSNNFVPAAPMTSVMPSLPVPAKTNFVPAVPTIFPVRPPSIITPIPARPRANTFEIDADALLDEIEKLSPRFLRQVQKPETNEDSVHEDSMDEDSMDTTIITTFSELELSEVLGTMNMRTLSPTTIQ